MPAIEDQQAPTNTAPRKVYSFCTTGFNRRHQVEATFAKNAATMANNPDCEWVMFDTGSSDGAREFVASNLRSVSNRIRLIQETSGHA